MTISSLRNPRVKAAVKLRERRARDTQQRIIIDGTREILRAVEAGVDILEVFACSDLCRTDDAESILADLEKTNARIVDVTSAVLDKLSFGERSEGIVAVAKPPRSRLEDIRLQGNSLIAVVERIEKPGNLGAILRTADAAGVAAVVAADPVTDLFNPNVIRASLGAVFTVPTVKATADETIEWLRENEANVYAARVDGSVTYTDVDYRGRVAVVLGNEAGGLTDKWFGDDIVSVALPMCGTIDSLNVSATAAVIFYEAYRQNLDHNVTSKI